MNATLPNATLPPLAQRIAALHAWYQNNVLPQRLTPEVERLWFTFFQQGYNGQQLARVVRYLRGEIAERRRNAGALKLRNLLALDEGGSLTAFDEDLALASAGQNLRSDKRLAPVPDGEREVREQGAPSGEPATGSTAGRVADPAAVAVFQEELRKLREELR
jgi:hypothetical protein